MAGNKGDQAHSPAAEAGCRQALLTTKPTLGRTSALALVLEGVSPTAD